METYFAKVESVKFIVDNDGKFTNTITQTKMYIFFRRYAKNAYADILYYINRNIDIKNDADEVRITISRKGDS